jgi:CheY-like chemotaxis protein
MHESGKEAIAERGHDIVPVVMSADALQLHLKRSFDAAVTENILQRRLEVRFPVGQALKNLPVTAVVLRQDQLRSFPMNRRRCRVLVVDWDEDILITLQHVLENGDVDTTITWDETEARKLIKKGSFDLVLLGDHPPELKAATILRDLNSNLTSIPCLLLGASSMGSEELPRIGVGAMLPKRDPQGVLEEVKKHWDARQSEIGPTATTGNPGPATSHLETYRQAG